jgi:hypothetical protein
MGAGAALFIGVVRILQGSIRVRVGVRPAHR